MTAFARAQNQGEWGSFVCEIRSINHRYLEISLHLPEMLRFFEMPMREQIRKFVKRGKIECSIRFQPSIKMADALFSMNTLLAQELCRACEQIATMLRNPGLANPTDILRFPGVLETKDADIGTLQTEVSHLLEETLKELVSARAREGEELKQLFLDRMDLMQKELAHVKIRLPQVMADAQNRLNKRFTDAKVELDPGRLEQEMVMFAQKIDISEEIERAETHIGEIKRTLKQGDLVGRRLDFLLQELNREANTLGSKSVDSLITHAAIEMKVLIEQVREQVQNVE